MSNLTLTLYGRLHEQLRQHLFPKDGCEAAAVLLCGWAPGPRRRLLVREAIMVPYDACDQRTPDALTWPWEFIEQAIDQAEPEGLVLILLHSHPGGFLGFSATDDRSDALTMPSLLGAYGTCHGSAVMTPSGAIRARLYTRAQKPKSDLEVQMFDLVSIMGDRLLYCWADDAEGNRPLAFSQAMTGELGRLSAAVVGVSGTGSLVAEQLARLGFGHVVLIDFDEVKEKNLNRIVNATRQDAEARRLKVEVMAEAITRYRGAGVAEPVAASLSSREAVLAAAQCDVLFSCVDSLEGRQIADMMALAYLMPLFDVGVTIAVCRPETGATIADVCGRIDYVQPGGTTLTDREVYSPEDVTQEYYRRLDPETSLAQDAQGYFQGIHEEAPSVITLNMRAASACVNEFVSRAYPFRQSRAPGAYARTRFSLADCEEEYFSESDFTQAKARHPLLALGDLSSVLAFLREPVS